MKVTDNLRRQHKELMEIVTEITSHLIPDKLAKDATYVSGLLLELAEDLRVHLAREDKALYPALFRHPDKMISKLAKDYLDEMGGISDAFESYLTRWPHAMVIQDDANHFINQTRGIFESLSNRINKEDNVLYPLLEVNK
jgi:iron-sulfur cluster repair protein YtfE (RIC family)